MNARFDIDKDGARVTRDGKTYQVSVTFSVEATDMDTARYWAADNLAALADMLMLAEGDSGPVIDDEHGKVGEWEIVEIAEPCKTCKGSGQVGASYPDGSFDQDPCPDCGVSVEVVRGRL